jgi:hypothetical protein
MRELSTISQIPAGASMGNIRHVTSLTLMLLDCDHLGNGGLQHADVPKLSIAARSALVSSFSFFGVIFFFFFSLGLPRWYFCSA